MSVISVFHEDNPNRLERKTSDRNEITEILKVVGVNFERWSADEVVGQNDTPTDIIGAYITKVDMLMVQGGYSKVDVINMSADHPDKVKLRKTFLQEHTHSEDEVRFFVKGNGLFALHIKPKVYEILCTEGDLISVPANTPHWFDMGAEPSFIAIRFFNNPEGWVAQYTDSNIADQFSRFESTEGAIC